MTGPSKAADQADHGPARAWLVLAVGDDRQHGGNDGYDDEPDAHYSWDSTVPNHGTLSVGDAIVIWDKKSLVGASAIEQITTGTVTKQRHRCPHCGTAGIKARRTRLPLYKCYKCKKTFDQPDTITETVSTFCSVHDAGWVDLGGLLSGTELRALCESPRSQLSLRPLRWDAFCSALSRHAGDVSLAVVVWTSERVTGGHRKATVRVRIGQKDFRRRLIDSYGPVCAITGPAPEGALEAAHLYSYAEVGVHHEHGGLLLRRDIHRLFDLGQILIDPDTAAIEVQSGVAGFPTYLGLNGKQVQVDLSAPQRTWLRAHRELHRPAEIHF